MSTKQQQLDALRQCKDILEKRADTGNGSPAEEDQLVVLGREIRALENEIEAERAREFYAALPTTNPFTSKGLLMFR